MPLKCYGVATDDILTSFKTAKLSFVTRGGEVWMESEDFSKANELSEQVKAKRKAEQEMFTLYGVRVHSSLPVEDRIAGAMVEPQTAKNKIGVWYYAKPKGGLDVTDAPKHLAKVTLFEKTYDFNIPCYTPAYRGVVLPDDNGLPICEVTPYNVFVLFNAGRNEPVTKSVFEAIIPFAVVIANHNDPKALEIYEGLYRDQTSRRLDIQFESFRKMFSEGYLKEIKTLEQQVAACDTMIESSHKQIFDQSRIRRDSSIRLESMRAVYSVDVEKKAREEFDKLQKLEYHGRVRNIEVTNDLLRFKTGMIKWRRSPAIEPIDLGEYEVSIKLRDFRFDPKNLTQILEYEDFMWHHPHCRENQVCYGNLTQAMPQFAANRDFEALIMCSLKWLETVDVADSWGSRVSKWEAAHEKRRKEAAESDARFREKAAKEGAAQASPEKAQVVINLEQPRA